MSISITVDDERVYWTTDGCAYVNSAPLVGGLPQRIASASNFASEVVVDEKDAYWIDNNVLVKRVPKSGGVDPETIVSSDVWIYWLALDDAYLYYAPENGGPIQRVPKWGGSAEAVADIFPLLGMALDETALFCDDNDRRIVRIDKAGGPAVTLASPTQEIWTGYFGPAEKVIAVDETHVYWMAPKAGTTNENHRIYRVPKAGGEPETLAVDIHCGRQLAVDGDWVYWSQENRLVKVPKSGGASVVLAEGPNVDPYGIAIGPRFVYFTNWDGPPSKVCKDPL